MQAIVPIPVLKPIAPQKNSSIQKTQKPKRISDLHRTQRVVYESHARFRVVVCGRRWGKSRLALYMGLQAAMVGLPAPHSGQVVDMKQEGEGYIIDRIHYDYSPESPPVVVFAMPTLVQCKKIFWKPLLNLLTDHPTVEAINKAECTIKFRQPAGDAFYRPDIICIGLNDADGDRARGLRIGHINCDEFQDIKRGIFDEVIVPALADTPGSTALITLTPKGKVNHGYEFFQRAQEFPEDYKSFHFITTDNDKLPPSAIREIERSRSILAPRIYRQEHEASFEDFPGQIYDYLDDHHLTSEFPTVFVRVILGVDWGDVNPALYAVGVTRDEDGEDCYWTLETWHSDSGQNVLASTHQAEAERLIKAYGIKFVYCGHDRPASIREWGDRFRPLGVIVKQAFNAVSEGNNAVNGLLSHNRLKLRSPHCKALKEKMASYHRKQDRITGQFLDEPAEGQDDHECFVAGTMIATIDGDRPVETIRTGDYVLTRQGYKPVVWAGKTGVDRKTEIVELSNGSTLHCTPNHPTLIDDHWQRIDAMRYNKEYTLITLPCQSKETRLNQKRLSLTASSLEDIQAHPIEAIASIIDLPQTILSRALDTCIARFGSFITGKFLTGGWFTTKTATLLTMRLRTLNVSPLLNILPIIKKTIGGYKVVQAQNICSPLETRLASGIDRKRVGLGIENTLNESLQTSNYKIASASIAEVDIKSSLKENHDSAQTSASQHGGDRRGSITKFEAVSIAKTLSPVHALPKPSSVRVRVLSKSDGGRHDVYNLKVAGCPEFFANGVLVHNCDAGRYAIATDIYKPAVPAQRYQARSTRNH